MNEHCIDVTHVMKVSICKLGLIKNPIEIVYFWERKELQTKDNVIIDT